MSRDTRCTVLAVTVDLSDRKQAEERLHRAATLDAFRVSLADALRPIADPIEVQATATRVLGEYLNANRVAYFEVRGGDYVVEHDYVNGATALAGGYSIDSFGPKLLTEYCAGRTVCVSDVSTDLYLSPAQRSAYAAIQLVRTSASHSSKTASSLRVWQSTRLNRELGQKMKWL
jgi:hypothetical protein